MNTRSTALVLGGQGFIGGFIVSALWAAGWRVRVLARRPKPALGLDPVRGDLTRMVAPEDWDAALAGVSVVVNTAGILREQGRQTFEAIHLRAPMALAHACAARGIRFVQVSALGDPADGGFIASKHDFDRTLLELMPDAVVLRPSVVYSHRGSYGGTALLRALAAVPGGQLLPGDGHWSFQPIAAEDLARIVVAACARPVAGIHELGCAEPISLRDYQGQWRCWLGLAGARAWRVPLPLVRAFVGLGDALGRGPINRTIWRMLLRGNRCAPGAHREVEERFGVRVRALDEVLAAQPCQVQDRREAQLYFLVPWLLWSVVALWLASGLVGLFAEPAEIRQLAAGSALADLQPVLLARTGAWLDLALGLGLAFLPRKRGVVAAMFALALAYLLILGIALPAAWLAPLGGLVKNIVLLPALAVLWVLVERR